mgnify:CR=1 FL=1
MKVFDFTVKDIRGGDVALSQYEGKLLLIVNTASKCGFYAAVRRPGSPL